MKGTQCFYLRAKSRDLMVDLDSKQRAMGIARHLSQIATARHIYTISKGRCCLLLIKALQFPGETTGTGSLGKAQNRLREGQGPRGSEGQGRNEGNWRMKGFSTPLGFHAHLANSGE